jgi:citrate lyase beta subunit
VLTGDGVAVVDDKLVEEMHVRDAKRLISLSEMTTPTE